MIPVLAYHEVVFELEKINQPRSMHPSCCLPVNNFKEQIKFIGKKEYKSVFLEEAASSSPNKATKNMVKFIVITFDDGHIGNYNFAYPLLLKCNQKAIFFVTVDYIGETKMMDWHQLKEMSENGMSIQSHCMSHNPLEILTLKDIEYELKESKHIIEDKIGLKVDTISLPHGSYNSDVIKIAQDVDYRFVCTSDIGFFKKQLPVQVIIPRIGVRTEYSLQKFSSLLNPYSINYNLLKLKAIIKHNIRSIVGIEQYRKIYRYFSQIEE